MSEEAVKKQIEGVCEEISEKNGWTSFAINVGSQYPVRLNTKLEALIKSARAVGQERAVWTFKESQGGENPNKPGTHYTNRYLEKVEVGGSLDVPASPGKSHAGVRSTDERVSIERQTVLKAAITVYDQFADDDLFFAFCERAAAFVATGHLPAQKDAPSSDAPPQDDDIPF